LFYRRHATEKAAYLRRAYCYGFRPHHWCGALPRPAAAGTCLSGARQWAAKKCKDTAVGRGLPNNHNARVIRSAKTRPCIAIVPTVRSIFRSRRPLPRPLFRRFFVFLAACGAVFFSSLFIEVLLCLLSLFPPMFWNLCWIPSSPMMKPVL
jgi:hypothetical protein